MQFDKYEQIDLPHFTQNPSLYDMLVWRSDKKKFQRILPSQIIAAFVQDGITGQIAEGSVTELDYDPANSALFPEPDPNPADLNGDGTISTADLLQFLTVYGQPLNPTNNPNPATEPSIYKITYSEDDVTNPPITITHHVVGADGGDGNLLTGSANFSAALGDNDELLAGLGFISLDEAALDHEYDMGHPLTVPTQAFPDIPLDGDITIDSTDLFGVGNVAIARPNTQNIGNIDYDSLHSFQFSDIDKSGAFSNYFKAVRVEVDVQAYSTSTDLLHLALRGTYTRPGPFSGGVAEVTRFACSTWGGDPTINIGPFGNVAFTDFQPIFYGTLAASQEGGEVFSNSHKSIVVQPGLLSNGEPAIQTLRAVVGTPLTASLQPGEDGYDPEVDENGVTIAGGGSNIYLSNTYSVATPEDGIGLTAVNPDNPFGVPFYGNKNILLLRSGINETDNVKISLGFYSQFGNIDNIKIREVRFFLHPGAL
tara:strand:- start:174 stop:1616 length:1443 start_codon:yes stop_codon:yes gene_type:complete